MKVKASTIHHCALIIDLYMSKAQGLKTEDFKLIAVAALLVSTKFHEMKYPSANSLNGATGNLYSYELVVGMENTILATLGWDLHRY